MEIRLTGKKSIYEEITEAYERYIRLGALREGERLPSVRALAMRLVPTVNWRRGGLSAPFPKRAFS